jgi:NitT/TauT family transport system substrate-binding protein
LAVAAAACGGDDDDDASSDTDAAEATEAPADTEAPAETDAAEPTEAPAETDAAEPTDTAEAADVPAEPEQSDIKLGLIPIADVAPVFIGIERGFFEEEGLTVTTEFAAGGAAAIPALQSGDIDLAFGGYPSTYKAIEAGIPLVVTQEAVEGAPMFAGFYSMPDSGIVEAADMAGATVAVNTLDNIVQMALEIELQDAGLSLDDVTLVEIPFPEQTAALELGNVDVISVVEPFGTIARTTLDANFVGDMFDGRLEGFPVAGWQVTEDFAAENPNTIAAFNRAFAKATDVAVNEEGALAAIVPTYTSASPELAEMLNYPNMISGLDVTTLQQVPDLMLEQGLLDGPIVAADHALS